MNLIGLRHASIASAFCQGLLAAAMLLLDIESAAAQATISVTQTYSNTLYSQPNGILTIDGAGPILNLIQTTTTSGVAGVRVGSAQSGSLQILSGSTMTNSGVAYLGFGAAATGTATVSGASSTWTNNNTLYVGNQGTGTLNILAGGLVRNTITQIADGSGSHGDAIVTGSASTWTHSGNLIVGNSGTASLQILAGAFVRDSEGYLGLNSTAHATATVSGSNSTWTNSGSLYVGNSGSASLAVLDGARVTGEGYLGVNSGSTGNATLRDAGTTWTNSNLYVGFSGTGNMSILDGALVSTTNAGYVGRMGGSQGTVTVSGTGSTWSNGSTLFVGSVGTGTLSIVAGGLVRDSSSEIGGLAAGTALVSGTNSTWTNAGFLIVGQGNVGKLTISAGGHAFSGIGYVGNNAGSQGSATISGAGSAWTNSGVFRVGLSGSGNLVISDGGRLYTGLTSSVGYSSSASGMVAVNGLGSVWTNASSLYIGGSDSAVGGSGLLTIADGGTVAVQNTLKIWSTGQVNLQAGGTLTTNHLTGSTLDVYGRLVVEGNAHLVVDVQDGGVVNGSGSFDTLNVHAGGAVSPGDSPGSMTDAITHWDAGAKYIWEINQLAGQGGTEGADPGWDLWHTGDLTIAGDFTIELHSLTPANLAGALASWNPQVNQSWKIATSTNYAFASLTNLGVDAGYFDDFNALEGVFDLWSPNASDLYLTYTAVPEPHSALLVSLATAAWAYRFRRRLTISPSESDS